MRITTRIHGLVPVGLALLSGCVTVQWKEPVGTFREGVTKATAAYEQLYVQTNDLDREIYILDRRIDATLPVEMTDAQGQPTALFRPALSPEAVAARMDALSLLGQFGERLAALAGSDAPTRFSTAAQAIGDHLASIDKTFAELTKSGDPTAGAYEKPIGQLVGLVGEIYLEKERDAALARGITEGAPAAFAVMELLEKDLAEVIAPFQRTALKDAIATLVRRYNENRKTWGEGQRTSALEEIVGVIKRYEAAKLVPRTEAVASMRSALEALVAFAGSKHEPKDVEALAAAVKTFKTRAETVLEAVEALKKSPKKGE